MMTIAEPGTTMNSITILFILTSHSVIPETNEPTGVWMEELTTPYYEFLDAGYSVDIASIQGAEIPIDPRSKKAIGENPISVERFLKDNDAMQAYNNSLPIANINATYYDVIFLPGGHGTMFDLPESQKLA